MSYHIGQNYVLGIPISQATASAPPSKYDILETKELLKGFCINAIIPKFPTLNSLLAWRKALIEAQLQ